METFIILLAIMSGALVGTLITALVLQNKHGKVAAQVSVLEATLKSEAIKAETLIEEKEKHIRKLWRKRTLCSKALLKKKSVFIRRHFAPSNINSTKQWKKCLLR